MFLSVLAVADLIMVWIRSRPFSAEFGVAALSPSRYCCVFLSGFKLYIYCVWHGICFLTAWRASVGCRTSGCPEKQKELNNVMITHTHCTGTWRPFIVIAAEDSILSAITWSWVDEAKSEHNFCYHSRTSTCSWYSDETHDYMTFTECLKAGNDRRHRRQYAFPWNKYRLRTHSAPKLTFAGVQKWFKCSSLGVQEYNVRKTVSVTASPFNLQWLVTSSSTFEVKRSCHVVFHVTCRGGTKGKAALPSEINKYKLQDQFIREDLQVAQLSHCVSCCVHRSRNGSTKNDPGLILIDI